METDFLNHPNHVGNLRTEILSREVEERNCHDEFVNTAMTKFEWIWNVIRVRVRGISLSLEQNGRHDDVTAVISSKK